MAVAVNRHTAGICDLNTHEISTPILETRPVKVTEEERARMLQSEDMANLYVYIATQPPHVCINEVTIAPTWNRAYLNML
jgi:NADP-dependent 3-hydroxy acid dehydrogenase YdfG